LKIAFFTIMRGTSDSFAQSQFMLFSLYYPAH